MIFRAYGTFTTNEMMFYRYMIPTGSLPIKFSGKQGGPYEQNVKEKFGGTRVFRIDDKEVFRAYGTFILNEMMLHRYMIPTGSPQGKLYGNRECSVGTKYW